MHRSRIIAYLQRDSKVFVACAARCSTDLGRYPRGQNRLPYFHSSAPLYM